MLMLGSFGFENTCLFTICCSFGGCFVLRNVREIEPHQPQNIKVLIPQKFIYVALQETGKSQINHLGMRRRRKRILVT